MGADRVLLLFYVLLPLTALGYNATAQKLIVDTDMGFDVDDVGAVCLANALHDAGKVELLAVVHDTGCNLGIGGVSAINNFYGHNDVVLGAWKGKFGSDCNQHYEGTSGQNQYLSKIINQMGGPVKSSDGLMSGTDAYRKALAAAPDGSVNIASIGVTTNLADLLDTKGDSYSPMSGYDLIKAKVAKIVFMDGGYNFGCAAGNIGPNHECYGTAQRALKMPPNVRLVTSNKGANPDIYTGAGLQNHHPDNSPCKVAYKDWCCNPNGHGGDGGRLSWDPITVMIAGMDVGSVYQKEVNYGTQITADPDGSEHFFGGGTKNAQTDFAYDGAWNDIPGVIDGFLNKVPGSGPAPAPPSPPTPGATYTQHNGANCYGARDGHSAHGAKDLETPVTSSCGNFDTIEECEVKCDEMSGCDGVTVQKQNDGKWACFRKGDVNIWQCDQNSGFDTYTKNSAEWLVASLNTTDSS